MDREILINEFLDRLENTFSADVETCESANDTIRALIQGGVVKKAKEREAFDYEAKCTACGHVEFNREEARTALDRLFKDLRDFVGEIYADKSFTDNHDLETRVQRGLKKRSKNKNG